MKQRSGSDCGITCVAQLAGKSYREVKSQFGCVRGGMEKHELEWILSEFCQWERKRVRAGITVAEFATKHLDGRYAVACYQFLDCHVVAVIDGRIHGWDCGNWMVGRVYKIVGNE